MRIGITTDFRHSAFSSGNANTVISVASILRIDPANEVVLLYKGDSSWWSDATELQTQYRRVSLKEGLDLGLDLVVEISFFLTPDERSKVTGRCVWYCRKQALFTDLESSVYGRVEGRNLEGVTAIWLGDVFSRNDDLVYLQTLYPAITIATVPWIWTPDLVETHRRSQSQSPVWFQMNTASLLDTSAPWSIHCSETNTSNTSSCTLPLTILRYLFQANPELKAITRVSIHNTENLKDNQFFKDNVLKHCAVSDLTYTLMGRQRIIDWVYDPKSIVLSHSRFVPFTMANLEAIWTGIPLVHNSVFLRDLGHGLEKLYYPNNSIRGAVSAMKRLMESASDIGYISRVEDLTELRKLLLHRFFPQVKAEEWSRAILNVLAIPFAIPSSTEVNCCANPPTEVSALPPRTLTVLPRLQNLMCFANEGSSISYPAVPSALEPASLKKESFTVVFSDMWSDFNEQHNMFLLALENGIGTKTRLEGFTIDTLSKRVPDLVIFGPFGEEWKKLPEAWPKVYFTGENTPPILSPSVKLTIGYNVEVSDTYLRMPLWQFEIDWFGADTTRIRNPIPLPIDTCMKSIYSTTHERTKFCAFVVTNPRNPIRNQAFHDLSTYKPVDSAGRLFNTMGSSIFAGLGGGGGELLKHEFLKNYRFCLAYENDSTPGYTTEKLLHAKAAGCVPIYWGDPLVGRDFNEAGFLNASGCKTAQDLKQLVAEVDSNPERFAEIASVPALSVYTRDLVRRTFSEMVRRFLIVANRTELLEGLEPFLGAKTTEEADILRLNRSSSEKILLVTAATQKFWPSVNLWLKSLTTHRSVTPLLARVYVGADVSDSTVDETKSEFTFAEFIRFPSDAPEGFPDFWDPQHYAWKLWIYTTVAHDPTIQKGTLVFYMDAGSVLLRWPTEWVEQARRSGVSFLDDYRQQNRSWCHAEFCRELQVSENELAANQIAACLVLFVAGHPNACRLFSDALTIGQKRDVIVGKKWEGFSSDGKPFGHRHDQSILSILAKRLPCSSFYPIDKIYGDISARATFHNGQAVYVHRGNFRSNVPIVEGIDDAFVINLDRREDRKQAFLEAHPDLRGGVRRLPAYDGRYLDIKTPGLAALFKTNDFFWKKAVMGCALSHLKVWSLLSTETTDIQSILILEDDVRLQKGWRDAWSRAYSSLPNDWDCVYLGGVLPPNRGAFANTLERVGPGLARVAPNTVFGQTVATRYFHFCAYAYVLSRRGAKKILDMIHEKGYWTSADHVICNQVGTMNLYVVDPLVAGASQDDDPRYQTAEFNNFSRVDNFDSDLWNNDERFRGDEISVALSAASAAAKSTDIVSMFSQLNSTVKKGPRYICLHSSLDTPEKLYESKWLDEILQGFRFEHVSEDATFDTSEVLVAVVIRGNWVEQLRWLMKLRVKNRFKLLHLSDEYGTDPIDVYSWPEVTGVMRMYTRPDLVGHTTTLILPLGYHWTSAAESTNQPRKTIWSFAGTDWMGRSSDLKVLETIQPNRVHYYKAWNDPSQISRKEYMDLLLDSIFVACPRGQNLETYRFYEAMEAGCIPLFIVSDVPNTGVIAAIPFLRLETWQHAADLILHFQKNPDQMQQYRTLILSSWANYKTQLKEKVQAWLKN